MRSESDRSAWIVTDTQDSVPLAGIFNRGKKARVGDFVVIERGNDVVRGVLMRVDRHPRAPKFPGVTNVAVLVQQDPLRRNKNGSAYYVSGPTSFYLRTKDRVTGVAQAHAHYVWETVDRFIKEEAAHG